MSKLDDANRERALNAAFLKIETIWKGSVMKLGDHPAVLNLFTGALNLDIALGVGGLPRGRIPKFLVRIRKHLALM